MTHTFITLYVKGYELELVAEGYVDNGGSNSYGSDEPAWTEVEVTDLYMEDGRKLSKRLKAHILKVHGDYIDEKLIESEY